ncbi:hypothetical protein P872_20265 [Rhodonellum psychrophilum GCM71 = DSM 17998]|uniref:DUF5777 domain-containing protein n=2 Tax=Rhodonellum TaxID=336827 RepID=U5BTH6_9BACT|nr:MULTISPECIES: DUF5777 family beta-barrel protein [Rhodonellum]ERM81223.1 hypothetical protein P872_20265 [Rhodonellum psychrophilum GCM71 = DSM 17998]SDZ52258.1 hypothetical protein SAMN05444412_1209 [Rhodonellum ikkaensis]
MKIKILILALFLSHPSMAQLERKLADGSQKEELIFHAPRHINLLTVEPLDKKALHFAIMHTFGTIDGGLQDLYGLDNGANIQFSFEYGFSEKFSLGAARASTDKVYNLYGRYHFFSQTQDNKTPFSLSMMGGAAVNTSNYSFLNEDAPDLMDRTSYAAQLMLARKFSEKISVQLSPMMAYFNDPRALYQIEGDQNLYLALGFSGKYKMTGKSSLTLQWIPNLNNDLRNNLGVGIDLEAGGHVFQMYFVTSQALNEQYLLAGGNGVAGEKFRLGFNVNRIFATGKKKRAD